MPTEHDRAEIKGTNGLIIGRRLWNLNNALRHVLESGDSAEYIKMLCQYHVNGRLGSLLEVAQ